MGNPPAANVRKNHGTAMCERRDCLAESREVKSEDYQCGHKTAKANEGQLLLENARVEHATCNSTAQDRKDS